MTDLDLLLRENHDYHYRPRVIDSRFVFLFAGDIFSVDSIREVICFFNSIIRSVYKELHADHETGAADNK